MKSVYLRTLLSVDLFFPGKVLPLLFLYITHVGNNNNNLQRISVYDTRNSTCILC